MKKTVLIFDVNETILDIGVLEDFFKDYFGSHYILKEWFTELILYSEALSLSEEYVKFEDLVVGSLQMIAEIHKVKLTNDSIKQFKKYLNNMPAHKDVAPALTLLKDAGFRMVALTNSSQKSGVSSIKRADLSMFFDIVLSVEEVRKYKPSQEVYKYASETIGVAPENLRLIACHAWDILGAVAVGYTGALVTRKGNARFPLGPQADIIDDNLISLAQKIIALEK